jgi:hypothetical protein
MGMHQTKRVVYKTLGGEIQLLKEAATQRGVKIRILTPEDKMNVEIERKLTMVQERQRCHKIHSATFTIRYVNSW